VVLNPGSGDCCTQALCRRERIICSGDNCLLKPGPNAWRIKKLARLPVVYSLVNPWVVVPDQLKEAVGIEGTSE